MRTEPEEIKENVPSILDVQRIIIKRNNIEVKKYSYFNF